jgi:ATP-dependent Clp protease, protease subunit
VTHHHLPVNSYTIPTIYEDTPRGVVGRDLFSSLLKDNILFLGTPINDDVANLVCAKLLHLESENPDRDISLYINSPGGDVNAMFAIYDTMQYIRPDVATICFGQAASAAAILLAAGTPGKRLALPNARILLHQPYTGAQGQVSDLEIAANEIERLKRSLEEVLARHSGQPIEKIAKDTDRDFVMTAKEAKEYGIIDEVIAERDAVDSSGPIRAVDS